MLDVSVLPAFLLAVLVILATPGPDMAFLVATGINQGRRAAVRGAFGVTSAMTIWVLVAATGLGVALTQVPAALDAIRLAGSQATCSSSPSPPGAARGRRPRRRTPSRTCSAAASW